MVSVTFLVAVNQTETGCLTTSKLPPLKPGVLHNKTEYIYVGKCDYGALDFNISTSSKVQREMRVYIPSAGVFLGFESGGCSQVVEDCCCKLVHVQHGL